MWMLDALTETPFQKPFTVLALTLGAAFLLLAFFSLAPLFQPVLYTVAAFDLYWLWNKKKSWVPVLLVLSVYALGYFLLASYSVLFALMLSVVVGRLVYPATWNIWRSLAAGCLLLFSMLAVNLWQRADVLGPYLPAVLIPVIDGGLFAFLFYCSALPFLLKKDRVTVAITRAAWEKPGEAARIAFHVQDLHEKLKPYVQADERAKEELTGFTEKLINLCYQFQEIARQNAQCDLLQLDHQIGELKKKVEQQEDKVAKQQYQRALANKEKQKEQHQRMLVQEERMRAQILNYVSALENLRSAYLNQQMNSAGGGKETLDFFLHIAEVQAENQYQSSEAYQVLAMGNDR